MQPQKDEDGSKLFMYGPLRGRPDMWYEHIPRCQDDPNCFRSACGYCHPERDSRNTRWTWVYPERTQPQSPQYAPQPQPYLPPPPVQSYPKEIKGKSVPWTPDFLDTNPRPYNPWAFNSTELRRDFGSFSLFQRPHARFSSALPIESPKNAEKQGTQFFPSDQEKDKLEDTIEEKVVQEIEKLVNDTPRVQDEAVQDEAVQDEAVQDEAVQNKSKDEAQEEQKQEAEQAPSPIKALNEAIPTAPTPVASTPEATSSKASVVSVTASNTLEPKMASLSDSGRKEALLKSKSFQKEPLSFASETNKQLRIRKLAGHDQGRVQFSLKGGSSDSKVSKSSQSLQLEKTCRRDTVKKESSSQSLDTDASPPVEGWWEMFILFWFACGKKVRMLLVALCALFAVVFSKVVPKKNTVSPGHNRDNSTGVSKSGSLSLPPAATE